MIQFKFTNKAVVVTAFMSVLLLQLFSCKSDDPIPGPDFPDTPTTTPPVTVFGRVRMQWSPKDYRETFFDASKSPVRAVRENVYIQGSDVTFKVAHDFLYNEKRQLTQLKEDKGSYVNYEYDGQLVKATKEYSSDGQLVKTRLYIYNGKQLTSISEKTVKIKEETMYKYFYDGRGNLSEIREYFQDAKTGTFPTYNATRYSEYDDKKNVENLWVMFPYLPEVNFGHNNFREISYFHYDGNQLIEITKRKNFQFQYDKNGYPLVRTEMGAGTDVTASYSYSGL